MPRLKVKCSKCKTVLETEQTVDFKIFCKLNFAGPSKCPICGISVFWYKDDVLAISFC